VRKIIALVLIRCIAQAQVPSPVQAVVPRPAHTDQQKLVYFKVAPAITARYGKLRRGRSEELAIQLESSPGICPGCTPGQNSHPYIQMHWLEIDPAQEFSVQYSYDGKHFRSQSRGNIVFTKGGPVIVAKLKAKKDLGLGEYVLKGRLEFEVIGRGRNSGAQQVEISIPVSVVEHDAPVVNSSWPYAPLPGHKIRTTIATILLGPLLFPALLVIVLYLTATGEEVH
jgi:hypothetical protein